MKSFERSEATKKFFQGLPAQAKAHERRQLGSSAFLFGVSQGVRIISLPASFLAKIKFVPGEI